MAEEYVDASESGNSEIGASYGLVEDYQSRGELLGKTLNYSNAKVTETFGPRATLIDNGEMVYRLEDAVGLRHGVLALVELKNRVSDEGGLDDLSQRGLGVDDVKEAAVFLVNDSYEPLGEVIHAEDLDPESGTVKVLERIYGVNEETVSLKGPDRSKIMVRAYGGGYSDQGLVSDRYLSYLDEHPLGPEDAAKEQSLLNEYVNVDEPDYLSYFLNSPVYKNLESKGKGSEHISDVLSEAVDEGSIISVTKGPGGLIKNIFVTKRRPTKKSTRVLDKGLDADAVIVTNEAAGRVMEEMAK